LTDLAWLKNNFEKKVVYVSNLVFFVHASGIETEPLSYSELDPIGLEIEKARGAFF